MSILEILVIVLSSLFVATVVGIVIYRKITGKKSSGCCSHNCANCNKGCVYDDKQAKEDGENCGSDKEE